MKATKKFRVEMGHRLVNSHTVKCHSLHGHSYIIEVTIKGKVNPKNGMLIDFSIVKSFVKSWLDFWDHSMVIWKDDPICEDIIEAAPRGRFVITPVEPTAENMARIFFYLTNNTDLFVAFPNMKLASIRVKETDSGWVECKGLKEEENYTIGYLNIPYSEGKKDEV